MEAIIYDRLQKKYYSLMYIDRLLFNISFDFWFGKGDFLSFDLIKNCCL